MNATEFVDTNVLVYAHDAVAGAKRDRASQLLERLASDRCGAVSIQVLSEFYWITTRKLHLPSERAEAFVGAFARWEIHRPTHGDLLAASAMCRSAAISWWDALIVNSAQRLGCHTLWTEDLNDGQRFGSVTVRNPFRD